MTIIPELRRELDRAAQSQLSRAHVLKRPRQPARKYLRTVPALALITLGGAGLATGAGFVVSTETKQKARDIVQASAPSATSSEKLGTGIVAAAAKIRGTLPYPPGMRDEYDWAKYSTGATLGSNRETLREIQLMSETRAACLWRRYYLKAYDAGDRQGMSDAAAILQQAQTWPATRAAAAAPVAGDPWPAFATAATAGTVSANGRQAVSLNCYEHTSAELHGQAPLVTHGG